MAFRAVVFDLDGTLLNTLSDIADAANTVLRLRGFPEHPVDAYRFFVGDGALTLIKRILPGDCRDDDTVQQSLDAFKAGYGQTWDAKTCPYEGVPEMLDALAARDVKMTVLSNKPDDLTKRCVARFFAGWGFDVVLGQRDGVPKKPDPAGALDIAARLAVAPGEFLYLGDTGTDMQTASAAGMFPVGVTWGFRPRAELLENGAAALVDHPPDVVRFLEA